MAAGQNINPLRIPNAFVLREGHKILDDAGDGLGPAVLKGVFEIGRGNIYHFDIGELWMAVADQLDIALDVVSLGLGDAGRADADNRRLGSLDDVEDGLLDILEAAEDGRHF